VYPKSLGAHNLPVQLTGFVGRASELTQVGELLAENQLVTLTGAGGVAKPGWRRGYRLAIGAVGAGGCGRTAPVGASAQRGQLDGMTHSGVTCARRFD
jgi:hypothetical protein